MLYAVLKLVASTAYVAAAVAWNAPRPLLIAFALSWVGDALLLSRRMFLAGLAAFLLAHVAFAAAFVSRGIDARVLAAACVGIAAIAVLIWRWLWPHVKASLRAPVLAYIATIAVMVSTAVATRNARAAIGALLFFASDIAVARERFVAPGRSNRVWGLPLYYAAQFLIAGSG
jgi:uncharacterized membrane protein YhhN